jgi:hypothetical protein
MQTPSAVRARTTHLYSDLTGRTRAVRAARLTASEVSHLEYVLQPGVLR